MGATRRRALAVLAGLAVAVAAAALLGRFVLHGPVTGRALFDAVEQQSGSEGATYDLGGSCRPRGERGRQRSAGHDRPGAGRWRCEVWDAGASDRVAYDVAVRPGSSCFRAELARRDRASALPAGFEGCVHRWQWTVF